MRAVLLGPPGAGKGTQAALLAERWGVPAISTGDIFRANVSGRHRAGRQAKSYMDAGALVPDEVTNAMVRDRIEQDDAAEGFLLDGFPRNPDQAVELDTMLGSLGVELDVAIEITADEDAVTARLLKRAEIEGRTDDREDVIRERLRGLRGEDRPRHRVLRGPGPARSRRRPRRHRRGDRAYRRGGRRPLAWPGSASAARRGTRCASWPSRASSSSGARGRSRGRRRRRDDAGTSTRPPPPSSRAAAPTRASSATSAIPPSPACPSTTRSSTVSPADASSPRATWCPSTAGRSSTGGTATARSA